MSVYYEDEYDGIHIFKDLASNSECLYLEYAAGGFVVDIPLSERFERVLRAGIAATEMER